MVRVRLVFLLIIFLSAGSNADIDYSQIPQEWVTFLKHEFMNIAQRRDEIVPETSQKIIEIHHIEVPEQKADSFKSSFLDKNSSKYAYTEKDGKKFVRFFFDKSALEKRKLKRLKKLFPDQIKQEFLGVRLQGHSSYFVWKPDDKTYRPVILKFQKENHNLKGILRNGVRVNDFVEKTLLESNNSSIGFLPERFTSTFKMNQGKSYSYLIRDLVSPHIADKSARLVPMHGLLSRGELLKNLAAKKKMTVDDWIRKIYIPKLAEFSATINLEHGFYVEGHTQNLLAFINEETGDLSSIGFRDLSDVMVDSHLRISQGKALNYDPQKSIWSVVNENFVGAEVAKRPGYNIGIYTGQSVSDLYLDERKNAKLTLEFMEQYQKAAEKKLNRKITLSPDAKKYILLMEDYANGRVDNLQRIWPKERGWGEFIGAMSEIQQEIYEEFFKDTIPSVTDESFVYKQSVLKRLYNNQKGRNLVTYLDPGGVEKSRPDFFKKILFGFDGKGIFTYHPKTKKVLSYAHTVSDANIKVINSNKLRMSVLKQGGCLSRLLRNLLRSTVPAN